MSQHGTLRETKYTPKLAGADDLGSSLITMSLSIDQFRSNLRHLTSFAAPAKLIAVVKADAYGFGAAALAPIFSEFGELSLGVATPDEALELRGAGYSGRIILLGYTHPKCFYQIMHSDCQISIYRPENVALLAELAKGRDKPLELHVKVDSGMTRLGVSVDALQDLLRAIRQHPQLRVTGLFSHLAVSGEPDNATNYRQAAVFERAIAIASAELGFRPECHLANSGALINFPQFHYDAVRIGQLLYGVYPPGQMLRRLDITQCFRLTSEVIDVHRVGPGTGVSYDHSFVSDKTTTIVTMPYGYADGHPRSLANKGSVLIRGRRYPMVGNMTMDYLMADVGDDEVVVGDEVVFIGEQGSESIGIAEVCQKSGWLPYEISCAWGRRVRRVYLED